jgi:DNA primase
VLDQGEPKYLNSPETPLFHKGRELYGLYEARQELRQIDRLLVVEGYMDVVRLAQAGIHYAVATLGTATTPEHLNRIFRVTGDVVFSFDGDRAGRQAAWRALETCLPFAKDGRRIQFLFLPDGHDPDTLVAEEGREAFERRVAGAMPLSEYLVQHLSADTDLASVDGRARLAEVARPLVQRIPEGVYRELLIDRLAREVRVSGPRLAGLLGLGGPMKASAPPISGRPRPITGRGSLLSQALAHVLQFPGAAASVRDPESLRLGGERGLEVLAEIIEMLHESPNLTTAQLVERWRDRPEYSRLMELASQPLPDLPPDAASREFSAAVERLTREAGPERRVDELIQKASDTGLSDEEKQELRELQSRSRPGRRPQK